MFVSPTTFADPGFFSQSQPVYRINFWERHTKNGAWNLDAYVLTGAVDVNEVLRWVETHQGPRRVEVFVEVDGGPPDSPDTPRNFGLIRIAGEDPNNGASIPLGTFVSKDEPRN